MKRASRFQLNSFNHKFWDKYILGNRVLLGMHALRHCFADYVEFVSVGF